MIDLSNTELILTLTSVTPRDGRERIETRQQVLMTNVAIQLFSRVLDHDQLSMEEWGELQFAIYEQVAAMMRRVAETIQSDLSRTEWEAAGRPELGTP